MVPTTRPEKVNGGGFVKFFEYFYWPPFTLHTIPKWPNFSQPNRYDRIAKDADTKDI